MSLQSLLESENISNDLKLEMLARVTENLEIPITEELIDEWELNFPGGRKLSYTKTPEMDYHDIITKGIYDKPAKAQAQDSTLSKAFGEKIRNRRAQRQATQDSTLSKAFGEKIRNRRAQRQATQAPAQPEQKAPETLASSGTTSMGQNIAQGAQSKPKPEKTYKVNAQSDRKGNKVLKKLGDIKEKIKNAPNKGVEGRLKGNKTQILKSIRNVDKLRKYADKLRNKKITSPSSTR